MDQSFSATARDASGSAFAIVGISSLPTDWVQVFKALAGTELTLDAPPAGVPEADAGSSRSPSARGGGGGEPVGLLSESMTPPSVLGLNAYLLYAIGKTARRRLSDKLTARGLRLWHLTVMAMLNDLGPQMKTGLAKRLDMNQSDLRKIVDDLIKAGHAESSRDPGNRRRVMVRLTPAGKTALAECNADIATTDEDFLAPLDAEERDLLGSLLRRVHSRSG
ncbi:hypothetical protein GCM10010222_58220 [Streptomyces tanashiensis]|uniref:MarR family winged helix-turn-helix transcriptional regulator n=1 Tax=Streptomyces tanashiensis TaxID=67367 RepID=UPI0016796890|nr:MarR family winged helix-turn-helix transcriptional regulator [Streptomyces tanashiensis]GGT08813.1 hypothetical protein GCM10010222_58220 [Streptomyces tanashiensis]